jgi:hypothetical protein
MPPRLINKAADKAAIIAIMACLLPSIYHAMQYDDISSITAEFHHLLSIGNYHAI